MKNNGFTWMERIIVLLIIVILVSIVAGSLIWVRKEEGVKTKQTSSSSVIDKFNKLAPLAAETGGAAVDAILPNEEKPCEGITDSSAKLECETGTERSQNIQNCIDRYSD